MNKIVARFADGKIIKGTTVDFFPTKDFFHVKEVNAPEGTNPTKIQIKDLKALFFVKDYAGDPQHVKSNEFDPSRPPVGRQIKIVFKDGETLVGTTTGYQKGRQGFFVIPADSRSNNERCYVVEASTKEITFI